MWELNTLPIKNKRKTIKLGKIKQPYRFFIVERYFLVRIWCHLPFKLVFGWGEEGGQEWDVNFLLGGYMARSGPFVCAFH